MIKAPQNNIFVEVESEFNDQHTTKDGIKIYLTTDKFTSDDEHDSSNYRPTMIRRHYGTVIAPPMNLTKEIKVRQVPPGFPEPGRYIPNEEIERNKVADSWACLNSFVHEWNTCADFEMDVQEGDKIYFHHNTVTDDNHVPEIGPKVYKLEYQNAICVVREFSVTNKGDSPIPYTEEFTAKLIIPIAAHVLVEPLWEEGVEDLGNGKRGKITKSGIVTELHDKPEPLRARVVHVGKPMKGEFEELQVGDKVIYLPHSDYEVEIEGRVLYVMKYWEIIAKID